MATTAVKRWVQGCAHYKTFCKLFAPCCNNIYSCRLCHDEKENHVLNSNFVKMLVCGKCGNIATLRVSCNECGTLFGAYACLICRIFDNEDKGYFHCSGCGVCRIGGADNYYHCDVCNCCLSIRLVGNHKCIENATRANCPICLENLHTSRINIYVPICGHLLHKKCFLELRRVGRKTCPICQAKF